MFEPVVREKAKLRLGIAGPSGAGKTVSSLLIAYGIAGNWSKIGLVDTENGSGAIPVGLTINGLTIGQYMHTVIKPPFEPEKYIQAIKSAESEGLEIVILDSISHAWIGAGGLLDVQGQIASRPGYNSYTAWREVTPMHNAFVEAMIQSSIHVIATLRSKMEYAIDKEERGSKTVSVIRKVGMAPVQRDGIEYEFTTVLDIAMNHEATASKDRSGLFDGKYIIPSQESGKALKNWLETGKTAEPPKQELKPQETSKVSTAEKTESEKTGEKTFEIVLMGTPRKKNGQDILGVQAVIASPSENEGEVELLAPISYKEILTNGAALTVEGILQDGKLEAVSIKPITGGEGETIVNNEQTGNTITLLATPKPGTITYKGENITHPFAACKYPGNYSAVFAAGETLKSFAENDVLEIVIADQIEKDGKLMLFIKEAKKISSQQKAG